MKLIFFFLLLAFAVPECFGQFAEVQRFNRSELPLAPPEVLTPVDEFIVWIGPMAGINFNRYRTASFPYPGLDPAVISEQNGSGSAPMFGISCEFPLDGLNHKLFIVEAIYDSKPGAFNSGYAKNVDLTKIAGPHTFGEVLTDLTVSLSYAMLDIGFKYNFREGPVPVGLGVQSTFNIGLTTEKKFNKTVTYSGIFKDSVMEPIAFIEQHSVDISNIHSLRLSLRGQINYDIIFNRWFNISPFFGYDFPLTKVDNERSWSVSSVSAGIAVHFSLVLERKYH